eukprot:scaffold1923_cov333-Pavlova_lutheri.AAC.4
MAPHGREGGISTAALPPVTGSGWLSRQPRTGLGHPRPFDEASFAPFLPDDRHLADRSRTGRRARPAD